MNIYINEQINNKYIFWKKKFSSFTPRGFLSKRGWCKIRGQKLEVQMVVSAILDIY